MSAFILKIVAIFTMTCDHLSYLIFGNFSFLNLIGRIAFPIFAYLEINIPYNPWGNSGHASISVIGEIPQPSRR